MLSSSSSPEVERRNNPASSERGNSSETPTEEGEVILTIPDVALVGSQYNSKRIVPGCINIVDRGYAKYMLWSRTDSASPDRAEEQATGSTERPNGTSRGNGAHVTASSTPSPPNMAEWATLEPSVGFHRTDSGTGAISSISVAPPPPPPPPEEFRPHPIEIDLAEVRSLRVTDAGTRCVIVQHDGTTTSALRFPSKAHMDSFLDTVHSVTPIERSCRDNQLYLAEGRGRHEQAARAPGAGSLASLHEMVLFSERSIGSVWKFMRDFQQDPRAATLTGFGKLTEAMLNTRPPDQRPEEDIAEILKEQSFEFEPPRLQSTQQEGFEVVTEIRLGERISVTRESPLTQREWDQHHDAEGRVTDEAQLRQRIFCGGVEASVRPAAWRFLLGCDPADMTAAELRQHRQKQADDYFRMKLQWASISEDQLNRFSALRDRRALVEKDVARTDRSEPFFTGPENVKLLHDVLVTYCMHNFDLGYVQGMSDLLSPILFVVRDEVEAFWCFVGFMDRVSSNFELSQKGMEQQFSDLHSLLQVYDPRFCAYLDRNESSRMSFTFRWLLVWFKRELSWPDVQRLWEVLWTRLPCPNFVLLLAVAVLDQQRSTIMESSLGFSAIVKHINDLAMHIELEPSLCLAESIYGQLKRGSRVPAEVLRIIGIQAAPASPPAAAPGSSGGPHSHDERAYQMASISSNFQ